MATEPAVFLAVFAIPLLMLVNYADEPVPTTTFSISLDERIILQENTVGQINESDATSSDNFSEGIVLGD